MVVYGRQILDGLHLVRATLQTYDDWRLGTVARAILGRGKTLEPEDDETMPEAIVNAYQQDCAAFCAYCLEDSRLVWDILEKEGLVALTVRRSRLIGLRLERAWGSVAAFDFMYVSALRQVGVMAPTTGVERREGRGAPGGLVIEPQAGLYRHLFVFEFRSLYPSIVRTFNIDPLSHARAGDDAIEAPNGARFDREKGILPSLLEGFWLQREEAKSRGDAVASYAYKIIINSFSKACFCLDTCILSCRQFRILRLLPGICCRWAAIRFRGVRGGARQRNQVRDLGLGPYAVAGHLTRR